MASHHILSPVMMGERTFKPIGTPFTRALPLVFPTSMSSSILKTATGSMEYSESDSLRAFRLFLELITPVEFSRLLIARAQHLLRVWPPQTAADTTANKTVSSKPNSLSFESIFAFLTFFRTQDSPELPSGDLTSSTSVQTLYNHLVALERLLSVSSPREIQSILRTRLDDIVEDRDTIIQGLLDVLRSNTEDDAEDESSKQGNTPEAIDIFIPRGELKYYSCIFWCFIFFF